MQDISLLNVNRLVKRSPKDLVPASTDVKDGLIFTVGIQAVEESICAPSKRPSTLEYYISSICAIK